MSNPYVLNCACLFACLLSYLFNLWVRGSGGARRKHVKNASAGVTEKTEGTGAFTLVTGLEGLASPGKLLEIQDHCPSFIESETVFEQDAQVIHKHSKV